MPTEFALLKNEPPTYTECPKCKHKPFENFLRGQVQRGKKWFWLIKRPYCVVICYNCKEILGHESLPKETP